jgi:hypothetical protein
MSLESEYVHKALEPIFEFARLDGGTEVRNAGSDEKFAHFHWKGVHFKFQRNLPKTKTELRPMIAFSKEESKLSEKDLSDLLKILKQKPQRALAPTVYEALINQWEILNERDADYID